MMSNGKHPYKIAPALSNLPHFSLGDLVELQGELKDLSQREAAKLRKSMHEKGIFIPWFIWPAPDGNNYILDGHQRKRVLVADKQGALSVPCVIVEADSLQDAKERLLVISSQYGRITQEGLDTFAFDLDDGWLADTVHFDALSFGFEDDDTEQGEGENEPYSREIKSPVYTPENEKPPLSALYDDSKTQALITAITQSADLSIEEKRFLTLAAHRHTVFNFSKIADYYAHSEVAAQRLMEDNALVIIDFNRAIELGFVQLTKELLEMVGDEND